MHKIFSILLLTLLASCQTATSERTKFLGKDITLTPAQTLQQVWNSPEFDISRYSKIAVTPVNRIHLKAMSKWQKINVGNYDSEVEDRSKMNSKLNRQPAAVVGSALSEDLAYAFKLDLDKRFEVVHFLDADEKTLVIECALTELVPVKVAMIGFGIVGDGSAKGGIMAVEGLLKEGKGGKVVAAFSDRRVNPEINKKWQEDRLPATYSFAGEIIRALTSDLQDLVKKGQLK